MHEDIEPKTGGKTKNLKKNKMEKSTQKLQAKNTSETMIQRESLKRTMKQHKQWSMTH